MSGAKDSVIVADKGFFSKPNLSYLMDNGMHFILPLQDNMKGLHHPLMMMLLKATHTLTRGSQIKEGISAFRGQREQGFQLPR